MNDTNTTFLESLILGIGKVGAAVVAADEKRAERSILAEQIAKDTGFPVLNIASMLAFGGDEEGVRQFIGFGLSQDETGLLYAIHKAYTVFRAFGEMERETQREEEAAQAAGREALRKLIEGTTRIMEERTTIKGDPDAFKQQFPGGSKGN